MPAGRVLGVMLIALAIAALFNSAAMVRAGESMKRGHTRDIVLSVARPIDDFAGAIGLHLPRDGLDLAFGQESKTAKGTELETGSTAILRANRAQAQAAGVRPAHPRQRGQPVRHGRLRGAVRRRGPDRRAAQRPVRRVRGRPQRHRPDQPRVLQLGDQRAAGDRRAPPRRGRDGHRRQRRLQRPLQRPALRSGRRPSGSSSTRAEPPS